MSYYNTCRICGANLDPGERCECEKGIAASPESIDSNPTQHTHYGRAVINIADAKAESKEGAATMTKQEIINELILTEDNVTELLDLARKDYSAEKIGRMMMLSVNKLEREIEASKKAASPAAKMKYLYFDAFMIGYKLALEEVRQLQNNALEACEVGA